ncbi:MAG: DUF6029 family protein [Cyclobacteriaceae bacterium]
MKLLFSIAFALLLLGVADAQNSSGLGAISGGFQSDIQLYRNDKKINANAPDEKIATNNYLKLDYSYKTFQAGIRYEAYLPALLGYPEELSGTGIVNRYASYQNEVLKVTAGNYYTQFGSGLVLRAYEERSLGIDNSLDGIMVEISPITGVDLTGVYGTQREFFNKSDGLVRGLDGNFFINEIFQLENIPSIQLGASAVSKFQQYTGPDGYKENVQAYSFRMGVTTDKIDLSTEYVEKDVDPTIANDYNTLRKGRSLLVNAGYSLKGFGVNVTMRRLENMDFRSEREAENNSLWVNYLPAETRQHGYALPNIYPYGAQSLGEVGGQMSLTYNIKKKTVLGGKYGTNIYLNYSHFKSLKNNVNPALSLEDFNTNLFEAGDSTYYEDFSIEIKRKINRKWTLTGSYIQQEYNKNQIEGVPVENVKAKIGVLESFIKLPNRRSLRTEVQHLWTKQDNQNWFAFLAEYNMAPHWSFFLLDQYNYGADKKPNYYQVGYAYSKSATRISMSYGRQRGGIICVGGVCRFVPAASGLTASITTSF